MQENKSPEPSQAGGQSTMPNQDEPQSSGPDLKPATKKVFRWQVGVKAWNRTNGNPSEGDTSLVTKAIEQRLATLSLEDLLFFFSMELDERWGHQVKKNGRNIFFNKKLGRSILTQSADLERAQSELIANLQLQARSQQIYKPFEGRLWMMAHFYFPRDRYYTKGGEISETLPDLSNLLELPQDCMQPPKVIKTGKRAGRTVRQGANIISNDSHIDSLDGCRRLPGNGYKLELFLLRYRGHHHGSSNSSSGNPTS